MSAKLESVTDKPDQISQIVISGIRDSTDAAVIKTVTDVTGVVKPVTDVTGVVKPVTDVTGVVKPVTDVTGVVKTVTDVTGVVKPVTDVTGVVKTVTDVTGVVKTVATGVVKTVATGVVKTVTTVKSGVKTVKSGVKTVKNILHVFKGKDPHHPFKMLLIGETGSGKTSFLNLLHNCVMVQKLGCGFGADGIEQFEQFNDIKLENAQALSMESKTDDATLYNVEVDTLKIGVIDTPGFGDSRGFKQDKMNAQRIISALKREEYINCVCLVIHGRQARASASLRYVLTEITAILPRGILDNVIVVFSNTADSLDLNFDTEVLKEYFGKEVQNMFFVENPYCRLEKAKAKLGQLGIDKVAKSLKKAFDETSDVLTEMCATIADFPEVHTNHFVELYEKKTAIERNVLESLTAYDNQMRLEKSLKDAKAEVDAAVN